MILLENSICKKNVIESTGTLNNYSIINDSICNVLLDSTVGLDCMLMKKPLITFSFDNTYPNNYGSICPEICF